MSLSIGAPNRKLFLQLYILRARIKIFSYLITTGRISPTSEALRIAEFCLEYLNFRCFDADLTDREVQELFQKAYYSFEDYAIVHWIDHLASCKPESLPHNPRTYQCLAKQVEIFLTKHGLDSPTDSSTSDSGQLQILNHWDASRRLDRIAHLARQKISAESYLDLEPQLHRRRTIYEKLVTNMDPDGDIARLVVSFNGPNNFKCPKLFCDWFYDGFLDEKRRNEHLDLHDRPFRCTFEGCLYSELGYGAEKDLKRHLQKFHRTDGNMHWTFPIPKRAKELDILSAAEAGDLESVRRHVEEQSISANSGSKEGVYKGGRTPLYLAAMHNQVEVVHYLLGIGVDVNLRLRGNVVNSDTALGIAVRLGHTDVAKLLLENGASIRGAPGQVQILNEAVGIGSLSMVEMLLDKGASDWGLNSDLETPIEQAAKKGYADILRVLLRANLSDDLSSTKILLYTAISDGQKDVARVLFENGASLASSTQAGFQALHSAFLKGGEVVDEEMLDVLSRYGILNLKAKYGMTALHWAGAEGNLTMTRALLDRGLGIDDAMDNGETTLHLACRGKPVDVSEEQNGLTSHAARNYYAVVQKLLEKGANAEVRNWHGETPLQMAVQNDVWITLLLLNHGVDLNVRDRYGKTAVDHAAVLDDQRVVDVLRHYGSRVVGQTPLNR